LSAVSASVFTRRRRRRKRRDEMRREYRMGKINSLPEHLLRLFCPITLLILIMTLMASSSTEWLCDFVYILYNHDDDLECECSRLFARILILNSIYSWQWLRSEGWGGLWLKPVNRSEIRHSSMELELASYCASSWMMILTLSRDTLNCTTDVNDNATILNRYSCTSRHAVCNCNCFPSNDTTQCIFEIQIHFYFFSSLTLISFISGLSRCLLSIDMIDSLHLTDKQLDSIRIVSGESKWNFISNTCYIAFQVHLVFVSHEIDHISTIYTPTCHILRGKFNKNQ